jgi:hypothetical protein
MTSAYGMDGEMNDLCPNWNRLFCKPQYGDVLLGTHVLTHLDDRSLAKASQVSHGWKQIAQKTQAKRYEIRSHGGEPFFAAILEAVQAEPDEVTRAWRTLKTLMGSTDFQGQASGSVKKKLEKIQPRLLQPEALILRDEKDRFLHCLRPNNTHPALASLVKIIEDLEDLGQDPQFKHLKPENAKIFFSLKSHYQNYLENLLDPNSDRVALLQPKVILSGEGCFEKVLMNLGVGMTHGICSYRISQEMALSLLSKDRYGLFLKSNTSGSHAVKRQGQVHFKGNTTTTGLPVGMESAAYWFAKTLFGQGMAPTALLTFNEVDIKTPPQGTQARSDYSAALGYSLRLMSKNPSQEELNKIQPGELALFCTDDKLYCKISTKEKLEIAKLHSNVGLLSEVFERILETLKNILTQDQLVSDFKGITSSDRNALLQHLSQDYIKNPNVTSADFFKNHPHHQGAFTEQNPHHVLQASLHVEGVSLDEFMKGVESGQYDYKDLDLGSFSELFFISLLTNPSDGTPGNFMVRTDQGKPYSIVGIDNDMAFGPAVIGVGKDFKPSLEVKNVLYCLPPMEQPLSIETRGKILSTSPELFLLRWVERLKLQHYLYDKLKETGYAKDNRQVPYLKEAVYAEELHLPLQLPCGMVTTLLNDFTKLQAKIKSRTAMTHNQLFSFFQPLAHRFYDALKNQNSTPLSAYQYIHNSHHEQIYLEDILAPHADEMLTTGQTLGQALGAVSALDQAQKQTLDASAQEIWKDLDLNKQQRIAPFLELAVTTFAHCFQDKTASHQSWLQNSLLFRALEEGASRDALAFLLNTLKLNPGIRDLKTQRTVLHYALRHKYPQNILQLLLHSLTPEGRSRILNGVDHQGLTPLDHAMEQDDPDSFSALQILGATNCNASIALKFYKRKVRNTPSLHAAFTKLMSLNPEVEWMVSLEELLPPLVSRKDYRGIALTSCTSGDRQLPKDIKKQILKKGDIIRVSNTANHPVAYAHKRGPLKRHGLYFKFYPALPGLEEATGRLTRQLIGFGAPYTDLVKLGEGEDAVPCLISQGVPGDTLLKVLKTDPKLLESLDEEDLSGMLIAAMLTNPEDGKPDNYIVMLHPTKPGKYRIIGIDNDQAFVPAIVKEQPDKEFWTGKPVPVAQVKTILYCLNQMKSPIHPNIRTIIGNALPDLFLEKWLRGLEQVNKQHYGLFTTSEQNQAFKQHKSFIGVPFQRGAVKHIYEKFVLLRDLIAENPEITHIELLNKLEPRLAKRYQEALNKDISVEARFKEVDHPFYEVKLDNQKGESHTTTTESGDILQSMGIPLKEEIFNSIRLGKENCPVQALQELEAIRKEKSEETLKSLAARVGDINLLKTLTLESSRVRFLKELKKQPKTPTPQEQTAIIDAIIDYLSNQKGIKKLILPNFSAMDDRLFQRIPFEHLLKVDLRKCTQITYSTLVQLSKTALALEALNLGYLAQLKEVGDISFFGEDQPLIFKELKILNLSNCINLTKLLLQAPKLHYLNVTNCGLLDDQMLDGVIEHSPNLQKLAFEGCPLVRERDLREKFPNFTADYWSNKGASIKRFLYYTGGGLSVTGAEIDTSPQGLIVFEMALKTNENLKNLTSLGLSWAHFGNGGVVAFASRNWMALTNLDLGFNSIGNEGAKAFASGNLTALRELDLRYNTIGEAGVKALASGNLTSLTWLNLGSNNIGDEGAQALVFGNLASLKTLNLGGNHIGNAGAHALASGNLTALTELILHRNNIKAEGVQALASGNLTALTELNLAWNNIEDEGVKALASGNLAALTSLDLSLNGLGAEGVKILASGNLTALRELDLRGNKIGAEGAKALACGNFPTLKNLNVRDNNVEDAGKEGLEKRYPNAKIEF